MEYSGEKKIDLSKIVACQEDLQLGRKNPGAAGQPRCLNHPGMIISHSYLERVLHFSIFSRIFSNFRLEGRAEGNTSCFCCAEGRYKFRGSDIGNTGEENFRNLQVE
jgi:hypothetical protein